MKTISIGDIHGLTIWRCVDPDKYDKVIFMGDYVDSFDVEPAEQIENLVNIIKFKRKHGDKVVLLWGNHEQQYLYTFSKYGCSGYQPHKYPALHKLFNEYKDLFTPAFRVNNYLWTHAGVHRGWYNQHLLPWLEGVGIEKWEIDEQLKVAFDNEHPAIFQVGHLRGGFEDMGGIFWLDKRLGSKKPLEGYHQIVGHHRTKEIITYTLTEDTSITYIDVLEDKGAFYELNIDT